MCVWAGHVMGDAKLDEEGIELLIFTPNPFARLGSCG
jgi:hypothetical protein